MGQDNGGKGCNIREKSTFSTDGGAWRESRFDTMKAYGTGQLLSRFMGREYYTNWCYVAGGRRWPHRRRSRARGRAGPGRRWGG